MQKKTDLKKLNKMQCRETEMKIMKKEYRYLEDIWRKTDINTEKFPGENNIITVFFFLYNKRVKKHTVRYIKHIKF